MNKHDVVVFWAVDLEMLWALEVVVSNASLETNEMSQTAAELIHKKLEALRKELPAEITRAQFNENITREKDVDNSVVEETIE